MKKLSNMKISGKIYLLVLIAMLGLVSITGVGQYEISKVFDSANFTTVNVMPSFNTIYKIKNSFRQIQISSRDYLLSKDTNERANLDQTIADEDANITKLLDYYERELLSDNEDKELLDQDRDALKRWLVVIEERMALARQGKEAEAYASVTTSRTIQAAVEQAFEDHIKYNEKLAVTSSAHAAAIKTEAIWIAISATALLLVVISVVGWVIANLALARP